MFGFIFFIYFLQLYCVYFLSFFFVLFHQFFFFFLFFWYFRQIHFLFFFLFYHRFNIFVRLCFLTMLLISYYRILDFFYQIRICKLINNEMTNKNRISCSIKSIKMLITKILLLVLDNVHITMSSSLYLLLFNDDKAITTQPINRTTPHPPNPSNPAWPPPPPQVPRLPERRLLRREPGRHQQGRAQVILLPGQEQREGLLRHS